MLDSPVAGSDTSRVRDALEERERESERGWVGGGGGGEKEIRKQIMTGIGYSK